MPVVGEIGPSPYGRRDIAGRMRAVGIHDIIPAERKCLHAIRVHRGLAGKSETPSENATFGEVAKTASKSTGFPTQNDIVEGCGFMPGDLSH
jgi:hypothetical protein